MILRALKLLRSLPTNNSVSLQTVSRKRRVPPIQLLFGAFGLNLDLPRSCPRLQAQIALGGASSDIAPMQAGTTEPKYHGKPKIMNAVGL
eukprot:6488971-Amphidinium_carterae.1